MKSGFFLAFFLNACLLLAGPVHSNTDVSIPAQTDWTDYGQILAPGALREWDYQLFGGLTAAALKKDGIYYLYYQGASGYRIVDDTVTWRAIGVATSSDGINFTKHSTNPVITWLPREGPEEGAVSAGATLDEQGDIVLYYGANRARGPVEVNADGRLTTSADGINFTDAGVVLDHTSSSVWGSGDELFPIIALHDAGQWIVYYIPNGTRQSRKLGVAWGDSRDSLTKSSGAMSGISTIRAWGTGGKAKIGAGTYALFLNDLTQARIEVRTVSLSAPNWLSAPVEIYQFDEVRQATILLDEETSTWFMYYRNADQSGYGVKLAPAGAPDTTPPTAPENVTLKPVSDRQIDISWDPATDGETGIVQYKVYRNGVHLGSVKGWAFSDIGLAEKEAYTYEVSAVNYHGLEGPRSTPVVATTLPDVTLPRVASVYASGAGDQVTVVFDEPVTRASAELASNYAISKSVEVVDASLDPDLMTVNLTTSDHVHGTYRITVTGVQDRAGTPNSVAPGTTFRYLYGGISGLVGAWTFDERKGNTAFDLSNYGNHGQLFYTGQPGPIWTSGKFGSALQFDGIDDQVTIPGAGPLESVTNQSYTFAAWVNPDSAPPNTNANNTSYSILVREYTGLYYDHKQRVKAVIRTLDGNDVAISSGAILPGMWRHVIMVADDENKRLHLYIDGQEASGSPVSYTGALADHGDAPYYIATSDPLTERYEYRFSGKIDEARIYGRALNSAEVGDLFAWFPSQPVCSKPRLPAARK